MAKGEDASRRAAARRANDAKKAAEQMKKDGSILPKGHQRGKGGKTKGGW